VINISSRNFSTYGHQIVLVKEVKRSRIALNVNVNVDRVEMHRKEF